MTAPPKRRWFRFSLRTMFVLVTVFAIWLGWNVRQVRQRAEVVSQVEANGGWVLRTSPGLMATSGNLPFSWWLVGARPVYTVSLDRDYEPAKQARIEQLFPEAFVMPYIRDHGPLGFPTAEDWERLTAQRNALRTKQCD